MYFIRTISIIICIKLVSSRSYKTSNRDQYEERLNDDEDTKPNRRYPVEYSLPSYRLLRRYNDEERAAEEYYGSSYKTGNLPRQDTDGVGNMKRLYNTPQEMIGRYATDRRQRNHPQVNAFGDYEEEGEDEAQDSGDGNDVYSIGKDYSSDDDDGYARDIVDYGDNDDSYNSNNGDYSDNDGDDDDDGSNAIGYVPYGLFFTLPTHAELQHTSDAFNKRLLRKALLAGQDVRNNFDSSKLYRVQEPQRYSGRTYYKYPKRAYKLRYVNRNQRFSNPKYRDRYLRDQGYGIQVRTAYEEPTEKDYSKYFDMRPILHGPRRLSKDDDDDDDDGDSILWRKNLKYMRRFGGPAASQVTKGPRRRPGRIGNGRPYSIQYHPSNGEANTKRENAPKGLSKQEKKIVSQQLHDILAEVANNTKGDAANVRLSCKLTKSDGERDARRQLLPKFRGEIYYSKGYYGYEFICKVGNVKDGEEVQENRKTADSKATTDDFILTSFAGEHDYEETVTIQPIETLPSRNLTANEPAIVVETSSGEK